GFRVFFTPLSRVLFTFPSRYWYTIGLPGVFSLGGWSRRIHTGFHVPRATQDTTIFNAPCPYGTITPYGPAFQPVPVRCAKNLVVLQPRCRRNGNGLGRSDFARRYSRNHSCFLFLRLLRCFSSAGSATLRCDRPSAWRVAPFGHPRIKARVQLPVDFRSLSRPSSPLEAQASPIRPSFACRAARTPKKGGAPAPLSPSIEILLNFVFLLRLRNGGKTTALRPNLSMNFDPRAHKSGRQGKS